MCPSVPISKNLLHMFSVVYYQPLSGFYNKFADGVYQLPYYIHRKTTKQWKVGMTANVLDIGNANYSIYQKFIASMGGMLTYQPKSPETNVAMKTILNINKLPVSYWRHYLSQAFNPEYLDLLNSYHMIAETPKAIALSRNILLSANISGKGYTAYKWPTYRPICDFSEVEIIDWGYKIKDIKFYKSKTGETNTERDFMDYITEHHKLGYIKNISY